MARNSFDPRLDLQHLEEKHRTLKQRVAHMERKAFLTPTEQIMATELKKEKLATKDAIATVRARS